MVNPDSLSRFYCAWPSFLGFLVYSDCISQTTVMKSMVVASTAAYDCSGVESFEKVNGVEISTGGRIPLFSSTSGAITADCYNRCRSSMSCSGFWIDYNTSECFRLTQPKYIDKHDIDFGRAAAYFERMCLFGDICSKAWVSERIPGYELIGYDDVVVRSVVSRKRCVELCLAEKGLPCRSADYWEGRKECRLSREDRRSQPGAFVKSATDVDYIENACNEPAQGDRGKECEWEVVAGTEFKVYDFSTKSSSMQDCQRTCETYVAFVCRSVTFDATSSTCLLSGSDTATTSSKLLHHRERKTYAQRIPCVDMSLECHGETMIAKLKAHAPFYGKMYTVPLNLATSSDCEVFGTGTIHTIIKLPLHSCGIQKDNDNSFIATLVVQQHPLIQKRADSTFRLVCSFPETNRTLTNKVSYTDPAETYRSVDISASASNADRFSGHGTATSILINSTAKSPVVTLRITDSTGLDVTGVSLGDELNLLIELEPSSAYGIIARDLIAKSGSRDDDLVLLDSRGCPEDPSIFPYLNKDSASKSLRSRFEAFKFTNDAVVRFQVHLQFCRHECPLVMCDSEPYGRRRRDHPLKTDLDLVELRREIIVSPHRRRHVADDQVAPATSDVTIDPSRVCVSKEIILVVIVGLAVIQVFIVVTMVLCYCQSHRDKVINDNSINNKRINSYPAEYPAPKNYPARSHFRK